MGVPEDSSVVSKILGDALNLDKDATVDRSHRTLQPKPKPYEQPHAIVAKHHYHSESYQNPGDL